MLNEIQKIKWEPYNVHKSNCYRLLLITQLLLRITLSIPIILVNSGYFPLPYLYFWPASMSIYCTWTKHSWWSVYDLHIILIQTHIGTLWLGFNATLSTQIFLSGTTATPIYYITKRASFKRLKQRLWMLRD